MSLQVIFNQQASTVGAFPGAMVAAGNAARRNLFIAVNGYGQLAVYPRSGNKVANSVGIGLSSLQGSIDLNSVDDPEMVIAEWWAFAAAGIQAAVTVMEQIEAR